MKKLIVEKVEDYIYYLLDNNNNKYKINMEFYDINYKVEKNDIIYMDEQLLKEDMLNFGELESPYGKIKKDKDIIVLKTKNKDFYLKRIYG